MLFVLTGQVQVGKTRWIEKLVGELEESGTTAYGVLAPGVWADCRNDPETHPHADANGFEKLGIDNVLLPNGERIAFARRADLAEESGEADPGSQSARAKLHWSISDDAIRRVNAHFAGLRALAGAGGGMPGGLLVVDELGQLELLHGGGLTEAVAILEDGPSPLARHSLVVVRETLIDHVEGRFRRWGETAFVRPDGESRGLVLGAVSQNR